MSAFCVDVYSPTSSLSLNDSTTPLNDLEAFYNDPTAANSQVSTPERMDYLLRAPVACQPQQFLIIYVHSAVGHHGLRQVVRSTWGNVSRWSTTSAPVTLLFVLGRPANDSDHQQRALAEEQAINGDLVQLDFVDTYYNMTLKAVGALQWLNDYCYNSSRSASHTTVVIVIIAGNVMYPLRTNAAMQIQYNQYMYKII